MFGPSALGCFCDIRHRGTADCKTGFADFAVSSAINCKIFTSGKGSLSEKLVAANLTSHFENIFNAFAGELNKERVCSAAD